MRSLFRKLGVGLMFSCLSVGCTLPGWAADVVRPGEKVLVAKSFRTSKLTGLNVRNQAGEKIGTVDDFVVNVENGKIAYAAIGVGGVLGIGEKLFAVPFDQMKFDHGKDEMFFVINISKEKLQAAPGFDKSNWPDFADPHWSDQVDQYYRQAEVRTRAVTP